MLRKLLSSNKDIAIPRDLGNEAEEDPLRGALITDLRYAHEHTAGGAETRTVKG